MTELPVDNLRDATPHLRRPFTVEAVKFRPVGGGSVVAYVDARCVIERLNAVLPGLWSTEFEPYPGGKQIICKLTVCDVTRSDVGTQSQGRNVDPVKGGYSDALKRAAVHFGVGVSLYALPSVKLPDGCFTNNTLNDQGTERLRKSYESWLENVGQKAFGDALDHGDVADSMGDPEAAPTGTTGDAVEAPSLELEAARTRVQELYDSLTDAQRKKKLNGSKIGLTDAKFKGQLDGCSTVEALERLEGELNERKAAA